MSEGHGDEYRKLTVNGLARETGVAPHVVRYYAKVGLLRPRRDPRNSYRQFLSSDVVRLRFIAGARLLGFSINDIRRIIDDADKPTRCPQTAAIITSRLARIEKRLRKQQALHTRMMNTVQNWPQLPDGKTIHCFIDSVGTEQQVDPLGPQA